jgi:hypothetical protein
MQDVIGKNVFYVLAGNNIDFIVPLFIQRTKTFELLLLFFRYIRKVMKDDRGVLQGVEIYELLRKFL